MFLALSDSTVQTKNNNAISISCFIPFERAFIMYSLHADAFVGHDSYVAYGETKEEVIAKMFEHLETAHPEFIGQATMQRLAELDTHMQLHIIEE